jgi:hypothetical protein
MRKANPIIIAMRIRVSHIEGEGLEVWSRQDNFISLLAPLCP